jgi:hypothetical protein
MNVSLDWLTDWPLDWPLGWLAATDAAGAWLSTYLLHSTVLLAPALLLGRWLGSTRLSLQESVLRVALIGGLLTASVQSGLGWEAATGSIAIPSSTVALGSASEPVSPPAGVGAAREGSGRRVVERRRPPRAAESAGGSVATTPARAASMPWLSVAVGVWLGGALLLTVRLAFLAWRLEGALRDRQRIREGRVFRIFWRLLAGADIDRPTALTRTSRLDVPIALGVGRREICLPHRVADQLPADQQETVLAHELAHLERHDPAWLLASRVVESLLFLQPLNRLARSRLQEVAEYRCDDWAAQRTGRPLTLARCLTEVATWTHAKRAAALAPTMAGPLTRTRGTSLGRRVHRLLDPGYSSLDVRPPSWWRPLAGVALVLVLVAVPGFSTVDEPPAGRAEPAVDRQAEDPSGDAAGSRSAERPTDSAEPSSELAETIAGDPAAGEPVVGSGGIVGPTDDFDASDPAIATVSVAPAAPSERRGASTAPLSRVSALPGLDLASALAPVVLAGSDPSGSGGVVPVVAERADGRVVVTVAPRIAVRSATRVTDGTRIVIPERTVERLDHSGHASSSRFLGSREEGSQGRDPEDQDSEDLDPEDRDPGDRDSEDHDSEHGESEHHESEHHESENGEHRHSDDDSHHDSHDDWDHDWDDDSHHDGDGECDEELEEELEALEDEIDAIVDELEETLESELEPVFEALESELDELEETLEESIELEMEGFEESIDADLEAFETEMERLEETLERRFEREGSEAAEERFESELERIEEELDRLHDGLDGQVDRIESRLESRLERSWERDFEDRLEPRFEELERRIDAESDRLEAMAYEMVARAAGGNALSPEDRERLIEEARRAAEAARPSPEEIESLRADIEAARSTILPAAEELEAMRVELRAELEELRAEAAHGLAEQRRALDELRLRYEVE